MTLEEKVKHWIDLTDRDIPAAELLAQNGHYLLAGFHCQQAVEKMIKGYFIKTKNEVHPHIHDLTKLAERSGLSSLFSEKQNAFIEELNPLYIEARYSEYKSRIAEYLTNDVTANILKQTKEIVQWIKEKM